MSKEDFSIEDNSQHLIEANTAYEIFVTQGPFYGKDLPLHPPTFRISSEPLELQRKYKDQLEELGANLSSISLSLTKLPQEYKNYFPPDIEFTRPISWRTDGIIDESGDLHINEINISDGADALMSAEHIAYAIANIQDTTPGSLATSILKYAGRDAVKLGWIVEAIKQSPYTSNANRMIRYLSEASNGKVDSSLLDRAEIEESIESVYDFDLLYNSGGYISSKTLTDLGVNERKVIPSGPFNALGNKALYILLHEQALDNFWVNNIGSEEIRQLQKLLIESRKVESSDDLIGISESKTAVVKIYNAKNRINLLERSRGVFGPWSSEMDWARALDLMQDGCRFLTQPFILPKQFNVLLRTNGGRNLEQSKRYNRICSKYVVSDLRNPFSSVELTATEATLGNNVVPTGRDTCFTPVIFR